MFNLEPSCISIQSRLLDIEDFSRLVFTEASLIID